MGKGGTRGSKAHGIGTKGVHAEATEASDEEVEGCIAGMMRILEGPKRSSPTGMALRGY